MGKKIIYFLKKFSTNIIAGIVFSLFFIFIFLVSFGIDAPEKLLISLFLIPGVGIVINNIISKEKQNKLLKLNLKIIIIVLLLLSIYLVFATKQLNTIWYIPILISLAIAYATPIAFIITVVIEIIILIKSLKKNK